MSANLKRYFLPPLLVFLCALAGCGEFLGFAEFPEPDLGEIMQVRLSLSDSALQKLYASVTEDDYAPCIYDEQGRKTEAWVRVRGFTSRLYQHKSFTVKIIEGTEELLYAFDASGSSVKNALAMYTYRRVGLPAPRTEAAALFINGTYLGCYTRLEMYSPRGLKAAYGVEGELFKGYFSDMGSGIPLHERSEKKFPDNNDFTSLDRLIYSAANLDNLAWQAWAGTNLDRGEIVKYMIVHDFLAVQDTDLTNFYIYNHGRALMLPWDNELCMRPGVLKLRGDNLLTRRFFDDDIITSSYNSEMRRLFIDPGPDNIVGDLTTEADRIFAEIEKAVLNDPFVDLTPSELQAKNNAVLDFLTTRSADLVDLVPLP